MDRGVDQIEKTTTNKGKPALLVNGFLYRLQRETDKGRSWRGTQKSCPARCKTNKEDSKVLGYTNQHALDHAEKDDKELAARNFRQNCRQRGAEELYERPSKLIRLEIQNADMLEARELDLVRRSMYKERRKRHPKLPTSRQETHEVSTSYHLTSLKGEEMIQAKDHNSGIIILSTVKSHLHV